MEQTEERKIVIPGETIVEGNEFLPSDGTYREGKAVIAARFGIVDVKDRYVRVIPVSGTYFPRRGNTIIGTIKDITMRGWLVDIGVVNNAFLPVAEVPRYINKNELRDFLDYGDTIVAKIWEAGGRGIDLSIKQRGFGKVEGGMLMQVNPNKVPRIIGKEGSMVKLIRGATGCNLTVGQNGIIWINGGDVESELHTKEIIEYVVKNATISGLTEKVEGFIKEMGLEVKELDIIEEDTDKEDNDKADEESREESEENDEDKA